MTATRISTLQIVTLIGLLFTLPYASAHATTATVSTDMADHTFVGTDRPADEVFSVGDVNNDGYGDFIISGAGKTNLHLQYGSATTLDDEVDLSTTDATLIAEGALDFDLMDVAYGDVNNDSFDDILIGTAFHDGSASYAGGAFLLYGSADKMSGNVNLTDADAKWNGEATFQYAGQSVAIGDINGDDLADIVIGAPRVTTTDSLAGALYVIYAGEDDFDSTYSLSAADAKITGEAVADLLGMSTEVGDFDGDGYMDILTGTSQNDEAGTSAGAAYVVYGSETTLSGTVGIDETADAKLTGAAEADEANDVAVGDLNGDGKDEVIVGARSANEAGTAYVLYGDTTRLSGTTSLANADALFIGEAEDDYAGRFVHAGDLNGDGNDELLIGATEESTGSDLAGAVYIVQGAESEFSGSLNIDDDSIGKIVGARDNAGIGKAMAVIADYTGNEYNELLLGSDPDTDSENNPGEAFFFDLGETDVTLVGDATVEHECSEEFTDANGATASDLYSQTVPVTLNTEQLDVDTVGDYTLTYNAIDTLVGITSMVQRTVEVRDTSDPTVALVGDSAVTLVIGQAFVDAGSTVTDTCDQDVSVSVTGSVDSDQVGTYEIVYNATDANGNSASQTRTVSVVEPTEEVLGAVAGYTKNTGGTVTVEYAGGYEQSFELFDIAGTPKVQLHTNEHILIAINKTYMRTFDAYTGEQLDQVKLFNKKQYKTKFKRFNVYKKKPGQNNVVVLGRYKKSQKKKVVMRSFVVKNNGSIVRRNIQRIQLNKKVSFSKLSLGKNKKNGKKAIVSVRKNGKVLQAAKYTISKKKGKMLPVE